MEIEALHEHGDPTEAVLQLNSTSSLSHVRRALQSLSEFVLNSFIEPQRYELLCRSLIDNVLPFISTAAPSQQKELSESFDTIFLHGFPFVAFSELCNALSICSVDDGADIVARTLVLFVSPATGGAQRLARVLAAAGQASLVNALVHLPARVSNVLLGDAGENVRVSRVEDDGDDSTAAVRTVIDETVYFATLAGAVCEQVDTRDEQRRPMLSALVGRMVVVRHAPTLVQCLVARGDQNTARALLVQVAPQSAVTQLVRALLSHRVRRRSDERFVREVLATFVCHSRAARDVCVYSVPFTRPLFRRAREALPRLMRAVTPRGDDGELLRDADNNVLMTVAEMWAGREFADGADLPLQRQVTRLLLYYMRRLAMRSRPKPLHDGGYAHTLLLKVADGVHLRLDEGDIRVRRHAMVVGEAVSRYVRDAEPLTFDRGGDGTRVRQEEERIIGDKGGDSGGDSDFSDIARAVGVDGDDDSIDDDSNGSIPNAESAAEGEGEGVSMNDDGGSHTSASVHGALHDVQADQSSSRKTVTKRRRKRVSVHTWPNTALGHNWQAEDGWSSPGSYDMTSSDEEGKVRRGQRQDEAALREKLAAPMSVARMLGLMREMNSSDGGAVTVMPEMALAALRAVASRAEERVSVEALRAAAGEFWEEVGRLEIERYPDEMGDALRRERERVLVAVMRLDVASCAEGVVRKVVCGGGADVRRRLEALDIMGRAVKQEWEEGFPGIGRGKGKGSRLQVFAEGLVGVFRVLAESLCEGGEASFVQVEGRDVRVWAQALVTLGVFARCGGASSEGIWMRGELLAVAVERVAMLDGDAMVRRAVALVVGDVVEGMGDAEVREKLGGMTREVVVMADVRGRVVERCVEWLREVQEQDADVGVRRFAAIGLRKWAVRLDAAAMPTT